MAEATTHQNRGLSERRKPLPRALVDLLTAAFGPRFTMNKTVCLQHGTDEPALPPAPPDAVLFPESTEEVAAAVVACAAHRVPVIAFGAGSSIEGHLLAVRGGVCFDMTRMDKLLDVRPEDMTATVQAGITRAGLNLELGRTGLFFSVDPGANATLGGMVATSASGTNTMRYGTMRDNVLSLTVVTAEGKVIRTARRARKTSAGYCLTQLFIGSEGTLGIVTEATLKLHPQPEVIAAAVATFADVHSAVSTVIEAIQSGVPLARAEMLDALTIRAINAYTQARLKEAPTLFLEFSGSPAQVQEQSGTLQALAHGNGGSDFEWATRMEDRNRLWIPRHHAYYASLQLRPGGRSLTTDACVPISSLARCIEETLEDIRQSGVLAPVFGHVGDGNFHCLLLVDPYNASEVKAAEGVSHRLMHRAMRYDGTCTGEHGVGLSKVSYLVEEHGADTVDVMRKIKRALDPHDILNPGKVVALPPAD